MSATVGIIGLNDLVPVLESAGVEVVTGASVKEAAGAIKARNEQIGTFPILVEDSDTKGLHNWATAVAKIDGAPTVAVVGQSRIHITDEAIEHIVTPVNLHELGEQVGVHIDSETLYPEPETAPSAESPQSIPDFDDDADDTPSKQQAAPKVNWDSTGTTSSQANSQGQAPTQTPEPSDATEKPAGTQGWDSTGTTAVSDSTAQEQSPAAETEQATRPQTGPVRNTDPYRDGLYAADASATAQEMFNAPRRRSLAPVITVFSGKGGVGKSSSSIQIATTAAAAGKRVILVDGNRGQGDISKYLALSRQMEYDTPTIADFLDHGEVKRLVVLG